MQTNILRTYLSRKKVLNKIYTPKEMLNMKKLFVIMLIAFAALGPLHLNNAYLRSSSFDTVTIRQGESLHTLADKYTVNAGDKEKLVEAICDINNIPADSVLQTGRRLQVPVLTAPSGTELAQNR